jgi:hypothetical protein
MPLWRTGGMWSWVKTALCGWKPVCGCIRWYWMALTEVGREACGGNVSGWFALAVYAELAGNAMVSVEVGSIAGVGFCPCRWFELVEAGCQK